MTSSRPPKDVGSLDRDLLLARDYAPTGPEYAELNELQRTSRQREVRVETRTAVDRRSATLAVLTDRADIGAMIGMSKHVAQRNREARSVGRERSAPTD